MAADIIDGIAIASQIKQEIKSQLTTEMDFELAKHSPSLAVILCSDDPASEIYVKKKCDACAEVGIESHVIRETSMTGLLDRVRQLNDDRSVNGILVQLPLPMGFDQYAVFDEVDPVKDVDVFSPTNVGLLVQGRPRFIPCTPAGIQELLSRSGIQTKGKKVAIINRSDVVGKPLHALLSANNEQANATCTLCHDHTPPELLKSVCLRSDIIVVAVGIPKFLTADMVPDGAVVVDVGINRDGKKIVGDVDFGPVCEKASWITKVPGGVGPMTVAMLLRNTVSAQRLQFYISQKQS